MYTYRLAVCEDDKVVREAISRFCDEVLTEAQIPHEITGFSTVEELEASFAVQDWEPHLLILDIETGNKTGMELAKEMRDREDERSIIFITGYEKYLAEGYDVQPLQFLLKPINWEKLQTAILRDWKLRHSPKVLLLQKGRSMIRIPFRDILYVEASGNHRITITQKEGNEVFQSGLMEVEQLLPEDQFLRCHKSYLVNLNHVKKINKTSFIMDDSHHIPIGRTYEKICQEAVLNHVAK